jgi:flagellar biosynthetic protein FliR
VTDLFGTLVELSGMARASAFAALAVFLRVGALMLMVPAFGEQVVPMRVKLTVALGFTAIITPAVTEALPVTDPFPPMLFATEVIYGLLLGFGLRIFIFALQVAGAIAAQATTLSQMFGGLGPEPQPIIGNVLIIAALAAAVAAGLHVKVAQLLILSYEAFPVGRLPTAADVAKLGIAQVSRAFALGFSLAAPFVIASVLYNVALGFINRAMPQLAVSFVGAPALTLGALALLALAAPAMLALWLHLLDAHFANPWSVMP